MTDIAGSLTSGGAVTPEELAQLIELGRAKGGLHLDEVLEVLKDLDLTPDTILGIQSLLHEEGIPLDEGFAGEADSFLRSSALSGPSDAVHEVDPPAEFLRDHRLPCGADGEVHLPARGQDHIEQPHAVGRTGGAGDRHGEWERVSHSLEPLQAAGSSRFAWRW